MRKLLWLLIRRCMYLGLVVYPNPIKILFCISEAIMVIIIFSELDGRANNVHNLLLVGTNLLLEVSLDQTHCFLGVAFHYFLCKVFLEINEFGLQMHAY